jgi:hypothetical protein
MRAMHRLPVLFAAVVAALAFAAGPASAAPCPANAGAAALDQYCEALPTAGGSRGSGGGGGVGAPPSATPSSPAAPPSVGAVRPVAPDTARALEQAGGDGAGVLGLGAPRAQEEGAGSGSGSSGAPRAAEVTPVDPPRDPFGAVGAAAADGPVASGALIWALIAIAVLAAAAGAVAAAERRDRRRAPDA